MGKRVDECERQWIGWEGDKRYVKHWPSSPSWRSVLASPSASIWSLRLDEKLNKTVTTHPVISGFRKYGRLKDKVKLGLYMACEQPSLSTWVFSTISCHSYAISYATLVTIVLTIHTLLNSLMPCVVQADSQPWQSDHCNPSWCWIWWSSAWDGRRFCNIQMAWREKCSKKWPRSRFFPQATKQYNIIIDSKIDQGGQMVDSSIFWTKSNQKIV